MQDPNPNKITGDRIYISPANVGFEKIGYCENGVIVKHLIEGWTWIVDPNDFLNRWRCG